MKLIPGTSYFVENSAEGLRVFEEKLSPPEVPNGPQRKSKCEVYVKPNGNLMSIPLGGKNDTDGKTVSVSASDASGNFVNIYRAKGFKYAQESDVTAAQAAFDAGRKLDAQIDATRDPIAREQMRAKFMAQELAPLIEVARQSGVQQGKQARG